MFGHGKDTSPLTRLARYIAEEPDLHSFLHRATSDRGAMLEAKRLIPLTRDDLPRNCRDVCRRFRVAEEVFSARLQALAALMPIADDVNDPYAILEVTPDAGDEAIKSAFRRACRKWHPDLNPDNPEAAERFQRIREAYERLLSRNSDGLSPLPTGAWTNAAPRRSFWSTAPGWKLLPLGVVVVVLIGVGEVAERMVGGESGRTQQAVTTEASGINATRRFSMRDFVPVQAEDSNVTARADKTPSAENDSMALLNMTEAVIQVGTPVDQDAVAVKLENATAEYAAAYADKDLRFAVERAAALPANATENGTAGFIEPLAPPTAAVVADPPLATSEVATTNSVPVPVPLRVPEASTPRALPAETGGAKTPRPVASAVSSSIAASGAASVSGVSGRGFGRQIRVASVRIFPLEPARAEEPGHRVVAPAPTPVAVSEGVSGGQKNGLAQGHVEDVQQRLSRFLDRYVNDYERRDVSAFLANFTARATENGRPIQQLRGVYDASFRRIPDMHYRIEPQRWVIGKDSIVLKARFRLEGASRDGSPVVSRGPLDLELVPFQSSYRVTSLRYSFD